VQDADFEIAGHHIGSLGLGCASFGYWIDEKEAVRIVHTAIDSGITLFDTSNVYPPIAQGSSERFLGETLGRRRAEIVLASKFGHPLLKQHPGAMPDDIRNSIEGSLKRLRTDWLDLYQLHKPDPKVPISDVLLTLRELVDEGKVLAIGCSQFDAAQLEEAAATAKELCVPMFQTVQNEYSMLRGTRQREVLETCIRLGVAYLPFFPLAGGLLTGKYTSAMPSPSGARLTEQLQRYPHFAPARFLQTIDALVAYAKDRGHTMVELAMGWLLSQPGVECLLVGASSAVQVKENWKAAEAWKLTPAEMEEVGRLLDPESSIGELPA
jgi:aryl-alcohol dehydrogenase-like predicted oxidoreductase